MTNPADVLTDEFVERVALSVSDVLGNYLRQSDLPEWIRSGDSRASFDYGMAATIKDSVRRVLKREREPVYTLTFEVRAPTLEEARIKLCNALANPMLDRSDITGPTERTS